MYLSFDVFSFSLWKNPVRDINLYLGYVTFWPKNMPSNTSRGFSGSLLAISYCEDTKNPFYFDFLYIRGIINFFRKHDNEIIE